MYVILLSLALGREMNQHEEVQLLLEGYENDLQEMQIELRSMLAQIEDTRKYVSTHQVKFSFTFASDYFLLLQRVN